MARTKPRLSLMRVIEMNLGFLGLQFSFGLQQGNMVPIYSWLGADEATLPILQLAGPMTGLLVQPLVGALSAEELLERAEQRPPLRQWARAMLVEQPVLYRDDVTDEEWGELRRRLGEEERLLQEMFGLALEVRAEGMAAIGTKMSEKPGY